MLEWTILIIGLVMLAAGLMTLAASPLRQRALREAERTRQQDYLFSHLKFLLELPPETDFDRGYLSAILEFTEAKRDTPEWKAAYVLVHPKLETMVDPPEKSEAAYDFASESDCSVCSKWPEKHREWSRLRIDKIPIPGLKPVCKRCFVSFWRNIGFPLSDEDVEEALLLKQEEGTKH